MFKEYWLMKSGPDVFSFDDLKARPGGTDQWDGVRNFQARQRLSIQPVTKKEFDKICEMGMGE